MSTSSLLEVPHEIGSSPAWLETLLRQEPWAEITIITTGMAKDIIEWCNKKNRGVRKDRLKRLVKAMSMGHFRLNGESIVISKTGCLLNGQHRLLACVESGVAIETVVVLGIEDDTFDTFDQHAARTVGNVLKMNEVEYADLVAAALKHVFGFINTGEIHDNGSSSAGFSPTIALEMLEEYPDIKESARLSLRCEQFKSPSLLAALHYVFSAVSEKKANDLLYVLKKGGGDDSRPFHVLREHLISARMHKRAMGNRELAAKTIKVFNAEVRGEQVRKMFYDPKSAFPQIAGIDYSNIEKHL